MARMGTDKKQGMDNRL